MVIADGLISAKELEMMYKIGQDVYHLSEENINKYIVSVDASFVVPETLEDKIRVLYQLALIAWADGEIDKHERDLLRRYVVMYKFEEENAERIVDYLLEKAKGDESVNSVINEIVE